MASQHDFAVVTLTEVLPLAKDGKLRLYGRESIGSWFEQALVARRQTHFSYDAETVIDEPGSL